LLESASSPRWCWVSSRSCSSSLSATLAAREELKLQFDSVSSAFEYEGGAATLVATVVSHLPGVPDAFEHEDRDAIMRLIGPTMESLKARGVTHLNVFRPPATNMLRVS
jgi:hypothetical protein